MSARNSSASSYRIGVLERAYRIIDEVSSIPQTVPELAETLDLDSATVYRIVRNLISEGYLRQLDDAYRYGLGYKLLRLGHLVLQQLDLRAAIRPYLEELAQGTGESSFLAIRDGYEVVYIDRVDGTQNIRLTVGVGDRRPLNAGASGKLLLAHAPPRVAEATIERRAVRMTDRTICSPEELRQEVTRILEAGYAESRGENTPGAASLAAPVYDSRGLVVAAVAVGGPENRVLNDNKHSLLLKLLDAVSRVSQSLGAEATNASMATAKGE